MPSGSSRSERSCTAICRRLAPSVMAKKDKSSSSQARPNWRTAVGMISENRLKSEKPAACSSWMAKETAVFIGLREASNKRWDAWLVLIVGNTGGHASRLPAWLKLLFKTLIATWATRLASSPIFTKFVCWWWVTMTFQILPAGHDDLSSYQRWQRCSGIVAQMSIICYILQKNIQRSRILLENLKELDKISDNKCKSKLTDCAAPAKFWPAYWRIGKPYDNDLVTKSAIVWPLYSGPAQSAWHNGLGQRFKGILAPLQFLVFLVSLFLVISYMITGLGYEIMTVSIIAKLCCFI